MNQKLISETKKYIGLAIYLFIFFEGFGIYRRLILAQYQIDYFGFGYSLVEALVLSKVILIGDMMRLGQRFRHSPLIVPTLYKTLTFSVFVLAFTLGEHFVDGFIHGLNVSQTLQRIEETGEAVILARVIVMFIAFVPLFAIRELGELTAENRLFELFFQRRELRTQVSTNPTENATVVSR